MTRTKTSKPPPAVRGAGRSHTLWTHALTAVLAAAAAAAASRHLSRAASSSMHRLAASHSPVNESERLQTEDSPRYAEHLGSYSEYIIIGAGPGGMQLGAFMEDGGVDYRIVERGSRVGTFWETYPRHDQLISLNKRYTSRPREEFDEFNLRHDWNSLLPAAAAAAGIGGRSTGARGARGGGGASPRFTDFSSHMFPAREEYLAYLRAYHRFHRLKVQFEWEVARVSRRRIGDHEGFALQSSAGRFLTCKYLIVATALGRPYVPDMEGIELADGYESVDVREEASEGGGRWDRGSGKAPHPSPLASAQAYKDQRVLILGLGNAAFEAAGRAQATAGYVHMIGRSHGGLKQSYFTHYVGDLRAVNNGFSSPETASALPIPARDMSPRPRSLLDTFFLKSLDTIDVDTDLEARNCSLARRVSPGGKPEIDFGCGGGDNPSYREGYDRVIRCLGWVFEDRLFEDAVKPALNRDLGLLGGKYPALTESYESVNVKNLYFAGTLSHAHDYKRSAGGFVHGFRYTARALYRLLRLSHQRVRWEGQRELGSTAARSVALALQRRFQSSSGLYQMFGELCDAVLVRDASATYMEEVPLRFIAHSAFPTSLRLLLTLHMDYGNKGHNGRGDLSFATREVGRAHYSQFLHPILRAYEPSADSGLPSLVSEFHIIEDLLTTWDVDALHLKPLEEWISRVYEGDYTSQEERLAARFKEYEANLTREERRAGAKKVDPYFGAFTFPAVKGAM